MLGIFIGALVGVLALTLLSTVLRQPVPPAPSCPEVVNCGNPPLGPGLVTGTLWRSADLGFTIEFSPGLWEVADEDGRNLKLVFRDSRFLAYIWVQGVNASEATPQELLERRVDDLGRGILGLADVEPKDRLLGPNVGYVDGPGGAFAGTADTPQGPGSPVAVAVMAATDGRVSAVVSIVTDTPARTFAFGKADSVFNTFLFPSEIA
jgi:hypothetical protein